MKNRILIIDDENFIRLTLQEGLKDLGYDVKTCAGGEEGLELLQSFRPDIILLDMMLNGENGLELAEKIKDLDEYVAIIIMTAYGDIKTAIKAIKIGATDYIRKPLDLDEIQVIISKALKNQQMQTKIQLLEKSANENNSLFLYQDPKMVQVKNLMDIMASNDDSTVLVRGETGTGKEVIATYIHRNSPQKDSTMVSINCSAIPEQLLESELFGFEKNAFSGAGARKKGLLEIADRGTLFLDELGEMSLSLQSKLLRFIETRKFKRIGGLEDIEVNLRIIAATNKDLEKAVKEKTFREDLYYRLNVVPIMIPALRERPEDIECLAKHFLNRYALKFGKSFEAFTDEALELMKHYQWPGNVRELKNMIERMTILNDQKYVSLDLLPAEMLKGVENADGNQEVMMNEGIPNDFSLEKEVADMEKHYIQLALEETDNNYSSAAKRLGISRHALNRRMDKYFK